MYDPSEVALVYKVMEPYMAEYNIEYTLDTKAFPLNCIYDTRALDNYSFVFPFETKLNRARFLIATHDIWIWSMLVSSAYLVLIFGGRKLMTYREKPFQLRSPLIIWNVLLATFSAVAVVRVSHEMFHVLSTYGFVYSVCSSTYGVDPVAAFWIMVFVYSKFVELLDTAFIVLRKKPLIFLHWYHHVTVLIFCCHVAKTVTAAGRWYAWMNYGVHSFMYSYYAIRAMNYRLPRWVSVFVTTLQLSQMVMGIIICYTVFRAKFDWHITCHQSWGNLSFAVGIYFSYFLLFIKLFYESYLKPRKYTATKKAEVNGTDMMAKEV